MFDVHMELYGFYKNEVRLTTKQRKKLAGYRDTNIDRLHTGLDKMEEPRPVRNCDQGSFPMHTTNQHPEKDYDIDIAVIFDKDDLPSNPLDSRKRVRDAMIEGGGNFSKDPEARTNAVTVWYEEGHHVDLAVHRRYDNVFGNEIIEHAGVEWTTRDPVEITDWFNEIVDRLSPQENQGASVKSGQMRRIVQLLKMFVKSRKSWNLPGGLLISVLVFECYVDDHERDDKALYYAMSAIHDRLGISTEVWNPVDNQYSLTYKDEYLNQVDRFRGTLEKALQWLEPLFDENCTRLDALVAWNKAFRHTYWEDLITEEKANLARSIGEQYSIASQSDSLYVASTGGVSASKSPIGRSVKVPDHRFFVEKQS